MHGNARCDWRKVLLAAKEEGISAAEVARRQGVSRVAVLNQRRKYGIELPRAPMGSRPKFDWPSVLAHAVAREMTVMQLARKLRVSHAVICQRSKRHGFTLRGQLPLEQREQGRAA